MYCESCGRSFSDHCSCLKTKPISKIEGYIILLFAMQIPFLSLLLFPKYGPVLEKDFLLIGAISLSSFLILLTIAEWSLKKSYLALFFGCHQKVNRTIKFFNNPLPLCARCSGIYIGVLSTVLFEVLITSMPFYIYLIIGLPLIIDGVIQKKYHIMSNNLRRFITGFLFGYTLMYIYTIYNVFLIRLLEILFKGLLQ
jgi:uncharacterized membrane protein